VDGGSYAELTLRRNIEDLARVALRQRGMRHGFPPRPSPELFGQKWSLPVALGPVGMAGMYARRGEVQAARAATSAGVPFALSSLSVCPIREIAEALERPFWLQLYIIKDRAFLKDLLAVGREA